MGLTACSSSKIVAKPTDYDNKLVDFGDDQEVYNNIASVVYDAQRKDSLASDVLDAVLYNYAISMFGNYNKVTAKGKEVITLKEAVKGITIDSEGNHSGNQAAKDFINSHKAYWTLNSDGKRENKDPIASEYARVVEKWKTIEKRIAQAMYSEISGGTYSDRSIFSEKTYLTTLYNNMENVSNPTSVSTFYKGLLLPSVEDYEVFTKEVLHRELYQSNYALTSSETKDEKNHYVEDNFIPTIYNELLVEQYLLNETYNTLGRSSARKVNIIAITKNDKYDKAADYLVNNLIKHISNGEEITLDTFKTYSNIWNGTGIGDEEKAILNEINAVNSEVLTKKTTTVLGTGYTYYQGTGYGDLIEKLELIKDNKDTTDTTVESEFTNSGAYPVSVGLQIKTNEIKLKDYTTTGWFIKNGGLSNLPDSIRNRLFNIGVANSKKETAAEIEEKKLDRIQADGSYKPSENESSYLACINGKFYLKQESTLGTADPKDDIKFYDDSSKTYYIIQVEEAVVSSKLSKTSTNSYSVTRSNAFMEEVVNEVARQIGQGDSYKSLAKEFWLKEMAIKYHDTVVYNYFKTNYPDLFKKDKK